MPSEPFVQPLHFLSSRDGDPVYPGSRHIHICTGWCRLYPLLSREAPGRVVESVSLCLDLAERLLNAYAAALAAVAAASRRALKLEYNAVRDAVLGHLLRHAELKCRQGEGGLMV